MVNPAWLQFSFSNPLALQQCLRALEYSTLPGMHQTRGLPEAIDVLRSKQQPNRDLAARRACGKGALRRSRPATVSPAGGTRYGRCVS